MNVMPHSDYRANIVILRNAEFSTIMAVLHANADTILQLKENVKPSPLDVWDTKEEFAKTACHTTNLREEFVRFKAALNMTEIIVRYVRTNMNLPKENVASKTALIGWTTPA